MKKTKFLTVLVLILFASILLVSFSACNKNVEEKANAETDFAPNATLYENFNKVKDRCIAPHIFDFRQDFDFYDENLNEDGYYQYDVVRAYMKGKNVLGAYQVDGPGYVNNFFGHNFTPESIRCLYGDYDFLMKDFAGADNLHRSVYGEIRYQVAMIENGVPTIEEIERQPDDDEIEEIFYSDDYVSDRYFYKLSYEHPEMAEYLGPYYEFSLDHEDLSAKCVIAAKVISPGITYGDFALEMITTCRIIATETINDITYRYVLTVDIHYGYKDEDGSMIEELNSLTGGDKALTVSEERCRAYASALMRGFVKTA